MIAVALFLAGLVTAVIVHEGYVFFAPKHWDLGRGWLMISTFTCVALTGWVTTAQFVGVWWGLLGAPTIWLIILLAVMAAQKVQRMVKGK